MERVELKAQRRSVTGKKDTKLVRAAGEVPGVVYKGNEGAVHLKVSERDLIHVLHTKAGENVLINLKIEADKEGKGQPKGEERVVIIKEVQQHPLKGQFIHVDFQEISLTEKIEVDIPIEVRGEAEGVVKEEGILEHILWELKIECLPTEIPENVIVEVSALKIGDSIHVKDLALSEGITVLAEPDQIVVSVVPPREEEPEGVPEEEMTEPELIREKKEGEEEAEEEEEEKEKKAPEAKGEKKERGEEKEG